MPYIKPERREHINKLVDRLHISGCGDLNYTFTRIMHNYLKSMGLKYACINSVIGVLECAKQELYRMIAAPYEDKKKAENGAISKLDKEPEPRKAFSDESY